MKRRERGRGPLKSQVGPNRAEHGVGDVDAVHQQVIRISDVKAHLNPFAKCRADTSLNFGEGESRASRKHIHPSDIVETNSENGTRDTI